MQHPGKFLLKGKIDAAFPGFLPGEEVVIINTVGHGEGSLNHYELIA
jgi:hypothetical protein